MLRRALIDVGALLTGVCGTLLALHAGGLEVWAGVTQGLLPEVRTLVDSLPPAALIASVLMPLSLVGCGLLRSRRPAERVLLLGASPLAGKLIEELETHACPRVVVLGVADDSPPAHDAPLARRMVGLLADLESIVRERRPDRIIVTLTARRGRLPVPALLEARVRGVVVEDGVEAYERLTGKVAIEALAPSALIFSKNFPKSRLDQAAGRVLSLLASIVGLVLLAPLFLVIAFAILLDSKGPVFFVQERAGSSGRPFRLIKFRTMHADSRHTSEWARDNDHRISRVGKWLRTFRLDELPQFINVLRGDMNLVGPRPHPVSNYRLFAERIPYYALRGAVRPGITGWAQVRYGYANNLEEETEKMRYDLHYVKHLSVWLDLRILCETVFTVLLGRGSTAITNPGRSLEAAHRSRPWKELPA